MRKRDLLRRKVEDIDLSRSMDLAALVDEMGRGGGFTAKKIAVGVEILRTMFRRKGCTTFLSFPAALMATGVRGVLRSLVERRLERLPARGVDGAERPARRGDPLAVDEVPSGDGVLGHDGSSSRSWRAMATSR